MTRIALRAGTGARLGSLARIAPMTPWSAAVSLVGACAVGYGLWRILPDAAPWVSGALAAGLAAWVTRTLIALRRGAATPSGAGGAGYPDLPGETGEPLPGAGAGAGAGTGAGTGAGAGSEAGHPASAETSRSPLSAALAAVLLMAMVLTGSVTAIPSQGLGAALLVVAVLIVTSDPDSTPVVWIAVGMTGALGVAAGALLAAAGLAAPGGGTVPGLLSALAALVLAAVAGFGRRAQRVLLIERERAAAEALRAQAAAHRIAIARDLHDVLAHSLGGLVVQLDAAEALLDAGDPGSAALRVRAARRLAVEGLDEAREAVRALRDPAQGGSLPGAVAPGASPSDASPSGGSARGGSGPGGSAAPVPPAGLDERIRALAAGQEGDGGRVALRVTGEPRAVSAALAEALVRAVQEGLSNARKHAPGSRVGLDLVWHPDRVELTVSNPLPAAGRRPGALAATGGGFGLRGVRERFAALGGSVQAGAAPGPASAAGSGGAGSFVLRAEAPA